MKKQTILENLERMEISIFLKMLLGRVKKEKEPKCNVALLERHISDLDRET